METAAQLMKVQADSQQDKTCTPKEIFRKRLPGQTKYEYCPYCVKECETSGKDYKESLTPLWIVKTEEYQPKRDIYIRDMYWYCTKCSRRITSETALLFYACRSDGTRYNENSKPFYRFEGTPEQVKVYYDVQKKEYVKV